jgi:hypothetical protein
MDEKRYSTMLAAWPLLTRIDIMPWSIQGFSGGFVVQLEELTGYISAAEPR